MMPKLRDWRILYKNCKKGKKIFKGNCWSIFLVRGKIPRDCPVSSSETSSAYKQWFTPLTKSMATTHNASHEKETESDNEN